MIYRHASPVGVLTIRPHTSKPGWWRLWIDDTPIANYRTATKAADAVATQTTGWDDWDDVSSAEVPADLSAWSPIR